MYCAEKAAHRIQSALDKHEIEEEMSRYSLALSLANLLQHIGKEEQITPYMQMALECKDETIHASALEFQQKYLNKTTDKGATT